MKKVLIIGPEFYDYNLSVERAFNNLGFETKVTGYHAAMTTSKKERIRYHLSRDKEFFFEGIKRRFNEDVIKMYNSYKPDLVFIIHGGDVLEETIANFKGCKKVLWMMDSISRSKVLYPLTKVVDYNFFFEKTDVDYLWELAKIKSWFLPLALDEKVYFPAPVQPDIDILFVGALYENRINLLQKIVAEFKDKNIKIYGTYYSPLRRPVHHLLRRNKNIFMNRNIRPSEVNMLYNRSKVCLNMHHRQSKYGVNQRFFEISGSKAFQLVDENPFISDHFPEDTIMTYKTEQYLLEKINYALNNPESTNEMAGKAYKEVTSTHTFTHRIQSVLDVINSQ